MKKVNWEEVPVIGWDEECEWYLADPYELVGRGTCCGYVGNKAFNEEVAELFKKYTDKIYVGFQEDCILLIVAKVPEDVAYEIARLVNENRGSLRPDPVPSGWVYFESE